MKPSVRSRRRAPRPQARRGASLVEALVAMSLLGVGILGVVGMQTTLRQNADVSRQRAEAVRLASENLEDARGFVQLAATAQAQGFADIESAETLVSAADRADANVDFTVRRTVPAGNFPHSRTLVVDVEWQDRATTAAQPAASRVRLGSIIAEVPPALAGSVSTPGMTGALQRPLGRHRAIPLQAVVQAGGQTSVFTPPGAPAGVSWVFNNVTGEITQVCSPVCADVRRFLLAGFVRFATLGPPSPADAETPPGVAFPARVEVAMVAPGPGTVVDCFQGGPAAGVVGYVCAVPTTAAGRWSGRSRIAAGSVPAGSQISAALSDVSAANFKVCRYTPEATHTPTGGNPDHPLDYVDVAGALVGQNFLVIRAGDDAVAFECPDDDPSTPLVNGQTFRHQPL